MKRLYIARNQTGATLVEVLVAIALTGIMLPALATALISSHISRPSTLQQIEANSLLREGSEAVRSVREKSWSGVSTNGTYYPSQSANAWTLTAGTESVDGFTRQIVIGDAERNSTGGIVTAGGTVDPSTKHVVVTVSWITPSAGTISTDMYLTRWQNNAALSQTSLSDFSAGSNTNTVETNTSGGEVQLSDAGADWQLPSVLSSLKISTGLSANDVFVSGNYAYVGYSGGLAIVDISNPAAPVLTGTYRTFVNSVYSVFVSGTTAYLATDNSVGQLEMIDVSNPAAPTLAGAFQIIDNGESAATSVYVRGTTAYVCKKQVSGAGYGEFDIVNVANPALPSLIGSTNIGADCNGITVSGTTAYLATSSASKQLTVIDMSDQSNPVVARTVNLGANGTDVLASGTTLYVTTVNNASGPEFRAYDITTPNVPTQLGSYEVGANTNGISVSGNYVQVATALGGKQFMVLDMSTPASPTLKNSIGLASPANKVYTLGNYAYVASGDTAKGLTIICSGLNPNGTFESSSLDASASVGFNRLLFGASTPAGTTLKFQIADNTDNATWNYVGPDGTASTYFSASGAIPLNIASGRYFRYKAYFSASSDGQKTPSLDSVTVNYSP